MLRHSGLAPESSPLIFLDSRRSLPSNSVIGGGKDRARKLISESPHRRQLQNPVCPIRIVINPKDS